MKGFQGSTGVENIKLFAFVVSAVIAGVAGALYRAAGRHHQPRRIRAGQLDRGRDLDRGRRARHADRTDHRRLLVNAGKTLFTGALARLLALCARRAVRAGHAVPAQGHRRHDRNAFRRRNSAAQRQQRARGRRASRQAAPASRPQPEPAE